MSGQFASRTFEIGRATYPFNDLTTVGFDSKDFLRSKITIVDGEKRREHVFDTPLGVGVTVENEKQFVEHYVEASAELARSFGISQKFPVFSSYTIKQLLGLRKAIPFCDQLIQKIQNEIASIYLSYVVLPPKNFPEVEVGGYGGPRQRIKTELFLRQLQPMFSYITAWSFFGIDRPKCDILIDQFTSKFTPAWDDLIARCKPKIFPHGDECNPFISCSDIVAFLTDAKLYTQKLKLMPQNIGAVWSSYGFDVACRFLDDRVLSKYSWYSDQTINTVDYLARPMTFLLVDELERLAVGIPAIPEQDQERPAKFREILRKMDPYVAATKYACSKGGGIQFFSATLDTDKVRDGDTLVYIGTESQKAAEAYSHMLDVEVLSAKELRKKVSKEEEV